MSDNPYFWIGFTAFILTMLALDLGVFHKKSHTVSFKEALSWTCVWITFASAFGVWIWMTRGSQIGTEFFAGYLIELSLSADNVFVFALLFAYFKVPLQYQHKVLFWGVLSALILRFVMILAGAALIKSFGWIIIIFGIFLVYTGLKMLFKKDEEAHPERNVVVRWFTKTIPTTETFVDDKFFVKRGTRWMATPLLVVLLCVEISDVVFAVDSIPAIFAVTKDPFIVFTSNVFAIMGLRSLYFVLAGAMDKFYLLQKGLGLVLGFVGVKMLLAHFDSYLRTAMPSLDIEWKIPTGIALGVVAAILAGSIVGSLIWPKRKDDEKDENLAHGG
jgi:tellurite resistance protein TerC